MYGDGATSTAASPKLDDLAAEVGSRDATQPVADHPVRIGIRRSQPVHDVAAAFEQRPDRSDRAIVVGRGGGIDLDQECRAALGEESAYARRHVELGACDIDLDDVRRVACGVGDVGVQAANTMIFVLSPREG